MGANAPKPRDPLMVLACSSKVRSTAMRLLYCGSGWSPIVDAIAARLPAHARIAQWDQRTPLHDVVADVEVIIPSTVAITDSVMAAARVLRLIQQSAAGIDPIDRDAAIRRGIPVCNAPGTNQVAVAEHALLLLLALARRLPA